MFWIIQLFNIFFVNVGLVNFMLIPAKDVKELTKRNAQQKSFRSSVTWIGEILATVLNFLVSKLFIAQGLHRSLSSFYSWFLSILLTTTSRLFHLPEKHFSQNRRLVLLFYYYYYDVIVVHICKKHFILYFSLKV